MGKPEEDAMLIAFLTVLAAQLPQAVAEPQPVKPKKICRESEHRTGSHVRSGTVCKTEEQWRIEDEARARIPLTLQVKGEEGVTRPQ